VHLDPTRGICHPARVLKVHHLENSRSQRLLWLLEELGLEYELHIYKRNPETQLAPPELKKIHPLGKSPLLEDDGVVYAETGAIIEHVLEKHGQGRLQATDEEGKRRQRFWLHYAEGSLMPILLLKLIFTKIESGPLPFFVKPVAKGIVKKVNQAFTDPQSKLHFDFVEAELGKSEWLAGDTLTVADVQMSFPLEAAASRFGHGGQYPKIRAFVDRVHGREAYKRALEKGGPYAYA